MMNLTNQRAVRIEGIPYSRNKIRGDCTGHIAWSDAVVKQTAELPIITGACSVRVRFFLPRVNCPTDCPFGNDLDNLLKRFFDALNQTIFRDAPGHDSCVTSVMASKVIVEETAD